MGLFDGYYDPDQLEASGGLLGRLMSLQRQQGILSHPDFDLQTSGIQPTTPPPVPWPGRSTHLQAQQGSPRRALAGGNTEVVGSAARGNRTPASDIDYLVPHSSLPYYRGLQGKLPGIDPEHGIVPGVGNPEMGPTIRFEPR